MNPKNPTIYPVSDFIANRWSPRAFSEKELSNQQIMSLFEAARWAASAYNEQPWRFIYAPKSNTPAYNKILKTLVEWNQKWAQSAPLLIVCVARTTSTQNANPLPTALYDLGLAVGNLTAQATQMGLFIHQMSGIDFEKMQQTFLFPKHYKPVSVLAVGYLGEKERIPQDYHQMEDKRRERRDFEKFCFEGEFKPDTEL